jgi:hypothetical protein
MTQDEVIALAEKCKLDVLIHSQWTHEIREFTVVDYVVEGDLGSLMQFAELVAQHTLSNIDPSKFISYQEGMEVGRLAEREACANTAGLALLGADKALRDRVLKAIRERGQA